MDALFSSRWAPCCPQAFLDFVGDHLPQEALLDLPILTGEELYEVLLEDGLRVSLMRISR